MAYVDGGGIAFIFPPNNLSDKDSLVTIDHGSKQLKERFISAQATFAIGSFECQKVRLHVLRTTRIILHDTHCCILLIH